MKLDNRLRIEYRVGYISDFCNYEPSITNNSISSTGIWGIAGGEIGG